MQFIILWRSLVSILCYKGPLWWSPSDMNRSPRWVRLNKSYEYIQKSCLDCLFSPASWNCCNFTVMLRSYCSIVCWSHGRTVNLQSSVANFPQLPVWEGCTKSSMNSFLEVTGTKYPFPWYCFCCIWNLDWKKPYMSVVSRSARIFYYHFREIKTFGQMLVEESTC